MGILAIISTQIQKLRYYCNKMRYHTISNFFFQKVINKRFSRSSTFPLPIRNFLKVLYRNGHIGNYFYTNSKFTLSLH